MLTLLGKSLQADAYFLEFGYEETSMFSIFSAIICAYKNYKNCCIGRDAESVGLHDAEDLWPVG